MNKKQYWLYKELKDFWITYTLFYLYDISNLSLNLCKHIKYFDSYTLSMILLFISTLTFPSIVLFFVYSMIIYRKKTTCLIYPIQD